MQTTEININPFQSKEGKEKLFQTLENDAQLFKETLEMLLTLTVSDPKLTFNVANLIESDFQDLYRAIATKLGKEVESSEVSGCCKDLK